MEQSIPIPDGKEPGIIGRIKSFSSVCVKNMYGREWVVSLEFTEDAPDYIEHVALRVLSFLHDLNGPIPLKKEADERQWFETFVKGLTKTGRKWTCRVVEPSTD